MQEIKEINTVEEAQKVLSEEKKERAKRAGEQINEILKRENCSIHFEMYFNSKEEKTTYKTVIIAS